MTAAKTISVPAVQTPAVQSLSSGLPNERSLVPQGPARGRRSEGSAGGTLPPTSPHGAPAAGRAQC